MGFHMVVESYGFLPGDGKEDTVVHEFCSSCHYSKRMILILMGVAGSGKTTIGTLLSEAMGWKFFDGDDFHPKDNIERMRRGTALTDTDREVWLDRLHELVRGVNERDESAILAFSALRKIYRERVTDGVDGVQFVFLNGDAALLERRIKDRKGHYFGADLLESQFETLEEPEGIPTVEVAGTPEEVVSRVRKVLGV